MPKGEGMSVFQAGSRSCRILTFVALFAFTISACTTAKPVIGDAKVAARALQAGDDVHIETVDGQKLRMIVSEVGDDSVSGRELRAGAFYGNTQTIAFQDIESLAYAETSVAKTCGFSFGVVFVILVISALAAATSLLEWSG